MTSYGAESSIPTYATVPEVFDHLQAHWNTRNASIPWYRRLRNGREIKAQNILYWGIVLMICSWISVMLALYNISASKVALGSPGVRFEHNSPMSAQFQHQGGIDTFANYKFRNICNVSSLEIHSPTSNVCKERSQLLTAMSSGGRIGFDAPYSPRGCDMHWFSTQAICSILARFDRVIFIGDSMMRHVAGSFNILMRMDLGHGAVTDWNFSDPERRMCFCNRQFDAKSCSVQGIYSTADVLKYDPKSLACSHSINIMTELITRFPIPVKEIQQLQATVGRKQTKKPIAFVLGQGLWNDLDVQAAIDWTDKIVEVIQEQLPHLAKPDAFFPRLFVTPNSSGKQKNDEFLFSQGEKALMLFEEAIGIQMAKRDIDHLGTWNMSIQASKYDGVHLDMRGNLLKAMMVANWLAML